MTEKHTAKGTDGPSFIDPASLKACHEFLQAYAQRAGMWPTPPSPDFEDPSAAPLLVSAEHGNITNVLLDHVGGHQMVGVSLRGRNHRFVHPLDFVAISLSTAFGLPLSLQRTGSGFDYPRFRATVPGARGRNIYLLPVLADAGPWQRVKHRDPISQLGSTAEGAGLDHHYLGRDALRLGSVREVWAEGKPARVPYLGRAALLDAALHYYDMNNAKADFAPRRDDYADMIRLAFSLADWRHGRADGKPVQNMPPVEAPRS